MPAQTLSFKRSGPIITTSGVEDTKDPCLVFDGKIWHIYGSGGSSLDETWGVLHATSPSLDGPWKLEGHAKIHGFAGPHAVAPGVIYDQEKFHMFLQTDCFALGSKVEYLTSTDGENFYEVNTALEPVVGSKEAGLYDPRPVIIDGQKYFVYSGFPKVGHGDIYLAQSISNSWEGPWRRLGTILTHEDVPNFQNQQNSPDYEWGLEGAQLSQLPSGIIILTAVCFLPKGVRGTRQRVFLAFASNILGPYKTLGPVLDPGTSTWESGENGHATSLIDKGGLHIFYQGRPLGGHWRYGKADTSLADIESLASSTLQEPKT